ncbi:hypothetical protein D9R13_17260 [Mycobacteroides abscessus subsp. massiliense]|nr:hypothetical protein D9R13_17260 [Mycobacteroides abscessus subsp. massiliense]
MLDGDERRMQSVLDNLRTEMTGVPSDEDADRPIELRYEVPSAAGTVGNVLADNMNCELALNVSMAPYFFDAVMGSSPVTRLNALRSGM